MNFLEIVAPFRRINLSSEPVDELFVSEVLSQGIIIGIQQACVAELRQCHDMRIIGSTKTCLSEIRCPLFDVLIVNASRSPFKQRLLQPESKRLGSGELPTQLTADDQLTPARFEPSTERQTGRRPVPSEHLMCDVIVKDGAHD